MAQLRKILLLFLISVPGIAQIGAKVQRQSKIHGLWQNSQFGYQMTLMLNADGSGEFDGETIKFTTLGAILSIAQNRVITKYTYNLQGNSLALSGGDLEGTVNFSRGGQGEFIPSEAPVASSPGQVITNTNSRAIIGVWSGNGETIEFRNDGQCAYLGNTFQYQLSPGHVTLVTNQGNVMFAYMVKGDQLSLTGNNQTVTYSRGTARNGSRQGNQSGKGQVVMELVGKWCYVNVNSYNSGGSSSSTCITLNADGTYEYYSESSRSVSTPDLYGGTSSQNSDRGTWYLQGDRIYYNSQTQGSGSYRLEKRNHPKNVNDPMIVLDGEAYVTAYNKPPWR